MLKKQYTYLLFILLVVTNCQPRSSSFPESPILLTPESILTTETTTPIKTFTTPTQDGISKISTQYQCLTRLDILPEHDRPAGSLALVDHYGSGNFFLYDMRTMVQEEFMPNIRPIQAFSISPNHQSFLYVDGSNLPRKNIIATLEGEITRFTESNWGGDWLDGERLIESQNLITPDKIIRIYNPLTGEDQRITLNIPNPYYVTTPEGRNILIISINPELSRAVFFDTNDGGRIRFWNLTTNKGLTSLPFLVSTDPANPNFVPALPFFNGWTPDGRRFLTTSPLKISNESDAPTIEELFIINYEGQITQLTHFSDSYNFVRITNPTWSPDGGFIAFWLEIDNNVNQKINTLSQQLVLLNMTTGEIRNLCLSFGKDSYSSAAPEPIWSPDGKYLIAETRTDDGISIVNLINIEENNYLVLKKGFFSIGWLVSP